MAHLPVADLPVVAPSGPRRTFQPGMAPVNATARTAVPGTDDPTGSDVAAVGQVRVVDGGEHVVCAECGALFRSLGTHLTAGHGLSAAAYRRRHHLPPGVSLAAPATRHRTHVTTVYRRASATS